MIHASSVTKRIKKQLILSNVSLCMEGIYGLVGPNGAGKTTLMKILAGLTPMDEGQVAIDERSCTKGKYVKAHERIGYLPQDFMVYPNITVEEALDHLALLQGMMDKGERHAAVAEAIQKVNLNGHETKKMSELSGGMRRRVGIAHLLTRKPSILLFDEPTAGLDIEERIRFRHLLKQLGSEHTIVISSHIVEDIEFLCTKIGVLKQGQVLFEGTPSELKSRAKGCVWEYCIHPEELDDLIATREVVQLLEEEDGIHARVFSKNGGTGGRRVAPRLIDGYLAVVRRGEPR
ncbi:ABC transporter ATP-binding protein [Geobacillus thermocatenulatus]|uniref:ABC transporter ATP-binding protein n=1 Tax=Geobacillus thermocatenulatus TaxID=33938 RepID=A0A226QDG8_9BACL|nr:MULTISPECIES: ABC transporter ATP-binding protein [Geobacillus]ASS98947.1 ABC transporter ATP-binding protein [Geobacillus thermocatenulatus]KLR73623.1 ABC transporter ATP-binding protein [Geobacillus sp. T6]OXB89918.1 ABC transporter ATP-binding protein [Geobacillus thermocatenulatus]